MLKSSSTTDLMNIFGPSWYDEKPPGKRNCRQCGGKGTIPTTDLEGFGYRSYTDPCPRCFPAKKTPAPRAKPSLADQIAALAELHEVGVLTDEEFKLAKQKVLGSTSPAKRKLRAPRQEDEDMGPPDLPEDNDLKFSVGDRVSHPLFGTGRVRAITGSGRKAEIVINFHRKGKKVLSMAFAPLTKI